MPDFLGGILGNFSTVVPFQIFSFFLPCCCFSRLYSYYGRHGCVLTVLTRGSNCFSLFTRFPQPTSFSLIHNTHSSESESFKVKVWKWKGKCESVNVKVLKWKCESVKIKVWKWAATVSLSLYSLPPTHLIQPHSQHTLRWKWKCESFKVKVWKWKGKCASESESFTVKV